MAQLTESVTQLIDQFAKLPGIGRKSAERLAYHILRVSETEAVALAEAIRNVKRTCDTAGSATIWPSRSCARFAGTRGATTRSFVWWNSRGT